MDSHKAHPFAVRCDEQQTVLHPLPLTPIDLAFDQIEMETEQTVGESFPAALEFTRKCIICP